MNRKQVEKKKVFLGFILIIILCLINIVLLIPVLKAPYIFLGPLLLNGIFAYIFVFFYIISHILIIYAIIRKNLWGKYYIILVFLINILKNLFDRLSFDLFNSVYMQTAVIKGGFDYIKLVTFSKSYVQVIILILINVLCIVYIFVRRNYFSNSKFF